MLGVSLCYFIFMREVEMACECFGFRGCGDGRTFNTQIEAGYLDALWSIQFIMNPVRIAFTHSFAHFSPFHDATAASCSVLY